MAAPLLSDGEVKMLVATGVSWAAAIAREGEPELACRLASEFMAHWAIDADSWNEEIDSQVAYADRQGIGLLPSYAQVRA